MRTYLVRLLTALSALSVLLFASVALAQEDPLPVCWDAELNPELDQPAGPIPGWTKEQCEAAGHTWVESWVNNTPEAATGQAPPEPVPVEQAPSESVPVEQAQTGLPDTQPARAQPGNPQYTG